MIVRAETMSMQVIVLPVRHVDGRAVYTQSSILVVKRLLAAGLDAAFLDPPESRTFEVKKSAIADAIASFTLGIGSSAAWDALKAIFRSWSTYKISITYVELGNEDDQPGTAWKVEGDSDAVLQAIDRLRRNLPSVNPADDALAAANNGDANGPFPTDGTDHGLREAYRREQVEGRRSSAQALVQEARDLTSQDGDGPSVERAEKDARAALAHFARSLDWAEDSEEEDEAHRLMDEAGSWVRRTFGCQLAKSGTEYRQTCPVALAHNRIGMSIGGVAERICSLCGEDLSECEHLPGNAYLVPGGSTPLGWCRVCLKESCDHTATEQYRVSVVAIIRKMDVDEVSLVDKPSHPEARLLEVSVPISELEEAIGHNFTPGDDVSCDRCLTACEGLIRHSSSTSRTISDP